MAERINKILVQPRQAWIGEVEDRLPSDSPAEILKSRVDAPAVVGECLAVEVAQTTAIAGTAQMQLELCVRCRVPPRTGPRPPRSLGGGEHLQLPKLVE
ncbi:hypothetical protein [Streptomyces sp. NPDC001843]|uniref:hypothetical protein n=1 Tax=Streptomyces sp. NPDC001843 TaxID=3364617 RepID=UPI0036B3881D